MASLWQRLLDKLILPRPERYGELPEVDKPPTGPIASNWPADPLRTCKSLGRYPNGFEASLQNREGIPHIFEPALAHYSRAFRLGDPVFDDPQTARRWRGARDDVMHHVLPIATEPSRGGHLVLRGSLLLTAWVGDEARQPGDLDFVFQPRNAAIDDPASQALIDGLIDAVSEQPRVGLAQIEPDQIVVDDIWTYERVPGRRLIFAWSAEGLPPGTIQMDIVYGEDLWEEPIRVTIPHPSDHGTPVLSVSPAVSLAWKLLWLDTDWHPQGKDLYDATLLAERFALSSKLLIDVLRTGDVPADQVLAPDFLLRRDVDWPNFLLECPWVQGNADEWKERLMRALAPTFEDRHA